MSDRPKLTKARTLDVKDKPQTLVRRWCSPMDDAWEIYSSMRLTVPTGSVTSILIRPISCGYVESAEAMLIGVILLARRILSR